MIYNVLSTTIIRVIIGGGLRRLTLSETLAALMRDEVESFSGLRPHQRHAWHMFLAYLAAIALYRADEQEIPEDAGRWAEVLLALTDGADEPWCLVVADLSKPAFLQPPVPEGNLSVLKNTIPTPDALDVLITAKNFDLKSAVATEAELDEWLFALISLQTMEGFLGATMYGIARMNGGFSARPFLGLAPITGGPGAHLRRDIRAMLALREKQPDIYQLYDDEGLALLWLEPWDGKASLRLSRLDPWFIEICRRIRFAPQGDGFIVRGIGTSAARIDAKASNGVTGDFWAPVNDAEGKAFSLNARGYSYRVLCRLLFGDGKTRIFRLPPAMEAQPGEGDMMLVARGITRGQGKTEGFHERIVPVRRGLIRALASAERRQTLGQVADLQQKEIAQISSALRFACAVVTIGGAPKKPGKDDYAHAEPYIRRLEAEADANFFDVLQKRHEQGEAAKASYLRHLIKYADQLLTEAAEFIPCPSQHRWRARVRAPGAFYGALWGSKSALVNDRSLIFPQQETADA
ncbi:type I-E CRISPR-associated protein Cse1/CasA [Pseudochelatococcus sp. B33]